MCNKKIRDAARGRGVMLWQIAAALGITDSSFSRKMRVEMSEDEQIQIIKIVNQIADERERNYKND